ENGERIARCLLRGGDAAHGMADVVLEAADFALDEQPQIDRYMHDSPVPAVQSADCRTGGNSDAPRSSVRSRAQPRRSCRPGLGPPHQLIATSNNHISARTRQRSDRIREFVPPGAKTDGSA